MGDASPRERRSRRAFARRQWARRWVTWKYVVAAVLLVGVLGGAAWLFLFSEVLAVEEVDVAGASTVRPAQVLAVSGVEQGTPLARVDLDAVRARVEAIAQVRTAEVSRQWPHGVVITVEERTPIARVEIGGDLRGLDAEGQVFPQPSGSLEALPRVETVGDTSREALMEAAAVASALPDDLASKVDHLEVGSVDQISLALRDGRTVIWGSAEESQLKAEVLAGLLGRPGSTYDVSVPGHVSVRP